MNNFEAYTFAPYSKDKYAKIIEIDNGNTANFNINISTSFKLIELRVLWNDSEEPILKTYTIKYDSSKNELVIKPIKVLCSVEPSEIDCVWKLNTETNKFEVYILGEYTTPSWSGAFIEVKCFNESAILINAKPVFDITIDETFHNCLIT